MRIGEVSRQAEVSIQTLRFYERKGFLPAPARSAGGYRVYWAADLKRVQFIKQSQRLGFTLKEIRELLDIHQHFAAPRTADSVRWRKAVRIARERLALIDNKIALLAAMRAQLSGALGETAERPQEYCPVGPPSGDFTPVSKRRLPAKR
ncbi:MAG TPA: heavy metal-responsive transcriptional regulator [Candidatus Acidoferrum sp.]|nr:heavy metal-responsive transcriptional regulator [Candidatus Acidoferrum sp.]